jgi:hypothetical protein
LDGWMRRGFCVDVVLLNHHDQTAIFYSYPRISLPVFTRA